MTKTRLLCACAATAIAFAAAPAMAQTAPDTSADADAGKDIVITGSIIRGTPEDAALPVNVIGSAELEKQGSPTAVELLKALPTSSGVLGDSNQFDSRSQGAEGIATANLRGLSPQRTLVLLNNRRLVTAGNGVPSVDINLIPSAAIGRIEVLKDGGATTYGSDAVAGVVNFITRTDQEGFRIAGNYKFVRSTDGDVDVSASYGHVGENFRVLVAASFTKRGQLRAIDRDFAVLPYTANPEGGWTGGGNPGNFVVLGINAGPSTGRLPITFPGATQIQPDTSCTALGGYLGAAKGSNPIYPNGQCYNQYSAFDNLVDLEKRGTAFVDFEADLGGSNKFEVTALYGRSTVPHYLTSPSYVLTQAPSLASLGGIVQSAVSGWYVPSTNPGFIAYQAANPTQIPAGASGVSFPLLLFRPFLLGGNPNTLGENGEEGASRGMRKSESLRFTAELSGKVGSGLNYSVSATYHEYYRYTDGLDSFGDRVQLALRGLGGPNCNYLTGTPGVGGCMYFNPFGNAYTVNPATGQTNPQGNAALANSRELTNWFFVKSNTRVNSRLFVGEASISGSSGIKLPGGDIQFGIGAQYRYNWFETRYGSNSNIAVNPCRDTPITGNTNPAACSPTSATSGPSAPNGAYAFLGTNPNSNLKGGVKAVYAEIQLPVFDSLNVQGAIRYEDYGGTVGSTVNPQVRARWQVTDWLALRGGYGTTFRGPTLANLSNGFVTALQLIGSTFKPVDIYGNASLKPEKSQNYSAGVLLKFGGFNASVDYFRYDLSDVIVSDPLAAMVSTLFPSSGSTAACSTALAARFTFASGSCGSRTGASTAAIVAANIADIARVKTFLQNGAKQRNSGLDFAVSYRSSEFLGSNVRFGIGADATYTIENRISDISVAGVKVSSAYDGVGLLNYQSTLYPLPEWKGQAYVDLGGGPIDARVTVNYIDGLHDQRADTNSGPFAPNPNIAGSPTLLQGANIGSFTTVDFNVRVKLPANVMLTATVFNVFDKDPPFAREDYSYEPFIGNPLGRQFKIGLSTKF